ncbi:MAG: hypothetical protein GY803_21700 [Chloroflexi bacterium]|nr:hypothetical protein [Chloroflexota bacterium]
MKQHQEIVSGLNVLLNETRKYTDSLPAKIEAMQEIYLRKNYAVYTQTEIKQLRYYLKAVLYKFYLATLNLEQLWALSHTKRDEVFHALENSLERLECSDDELLLISFAFEGFLFQGRSFLDFYMIYICLFLRTGHQGSMSRKSFNKALNRVESSPFNVKAIEIKDYFDTKVFASSNQDWLSPENWGTLLQSLRDKIAHRDRLRPSFDGDETMVSGILFDWPTLRETTYDRFCQYMQNSMFDFAKDVSELLFELEWKPGPYKADLWG